VRVISDEGALSLPFRLAVSMLVVAIALPMCMRSLSDGKAELSRNAAIDIADDLANTISEVSSRPIGESRILRIGEDLRLLGSGASIEVGDFLGGRNFTVIRCSDSTGWTRVLQMDLPVGIDAVCSSCYLPFVMGSGSGDVTVAHRGSQFEDIIVVEGA
jgi:hypothetical protein